MNHNMSRVLAGLLLLAPAPVRGDEIRLANGQILEGIVVDETTSQVKVQVTSQGYLWLDRAAVSSVERASEEDNQQLLDAWRRAERTVKDARREREALEADQRAKGLVKHKGRWITKEELAAITEQEARAERERQREAEAERTAQLIQALQEENRRLQDLVAEHQRQILYWRGLVHHQQHDPHLFRDEQGNLLRVQRHEGHPFFVAPDGKHVDLQSQEGALTFTDSQGARRTLEPAHHSHDHGGQ